jgi:hypothetical protein
VRSPASRQPNLGLLSLSVSSLGLRLLRSPCAHSCCPFWLSQGLLRFPSAVRLVPFVCSCAAPLRVPPGGCACCAPPVFSVGAPSACFWADSTTLLTAPTAPFLSYGGSSGPNVHQCLHWVVGRLRFPPSSGFLFVCLFPLLPKPSICQQPINLQPSFPALLMELRRSRWELGASTGCNRAYLAANVQ